MIKKYLILGLLLSFLCGTAQKVIPLYSEKVPNSLEIVGLTDSTAVFGTGDSKWSFVIRVAKPDLTVFLPDKRIATGVAVIICPGGGYGGLAIDHEGYAIAKKLGKKGITGFVLKYRLPNSKYVINKEIVSLQDAQRAIQIVRENSKRWGINPNKIGIEGNSAGGHLASTAGTHYQKVLIDNPLGTSLRPNFMILNYPVISMEDDLTHMGSRYNLIGDGLSPEELNKIMKDHKTADQMLARIQIDTQKIKEYSNELHVTSDTPPTFITHSVNDKVVKVQNSLLFIAALQKNKVPVESFFYAKGGHGYGIDNPTSDVDWIDACVDWILKINHK
ncbi:MAG TPA: alpha/beta hydrolase [Flavobacterium sp.]|uniref:alpha/beta hydrolase n=1 Tax=Flavobacterium sp. TaxID=239 RepID=UPI002DB7C67F|nr:alpha/beta hydrolase [Flavobacterium sp.]HEU4791680.1 alpha/beta hydrolase [Flavobacterium sp.]